MNAWIIACIAVVIAGMAYSYWRQFSYSIVSCVTCVAVLVMVVVGSDARNFLFSEVFDQLAFRPDDLLNLDRGYTFLTSMYTHASFFHLFFNIIALAFIGSILEQRIGTRRFMVVYLFAGLCGTLVFAGLRWNEPYVSVVGASGAISGVLGALARLYPHERMTLFVMFFPLPPMPMWLIVAGFVLLQLLFVMGDTFIAVEAHLGGLVAGTLVVPFVARLPLRKRVRRMVSLNALRRLARTPELKAMLRAIEDEEIADVRSAWIEEFLSRARCPHCGAKIKVSREDIRCEKGHML